MTDGPSFDMDQALDQLREIKGGSTETPESDATVDGGVDWRQYFPFDEVYPSQAEGIEQVVETGRENGYTVVEGACGSGKTLLALLAGVSLARNPDTDFERVFVVTSVKQQLEQFEADLRAINARLETGIEPVTAVTLVGKTDMCPYAAVDGNQITKENVSRKCADLREDTRNEVESTPAETLASRSETTGQNLRTDGVRAPYPKSLPRGGHCPFYAKYLAAKNEDDDVPIDFSDGNEHVADPTAVRRVSTERGICPHSVMGELQHDADVVVGNYYHIFSPGARKLTEPLIDDETFVVVDEAHTLEERVRGLFETSISSSRLETALTELEEVREDASGNGGVAEVCRAALAEHGVVPDGLKETEAFLTWIRDRVDARISRTLERKHGDWQSNWGAVPDEFEIELRDPDKPGPDEITRWAGEAGFDENDWRRVAEVGRAVERYLVAKRDEDDVTVALPGIGIALEQWYERDHTRYFREIELSKSSTPSVDVTEWSDVYNANLVLVDCLPTDELATRFDEFGGGLLMSATLAPLDVFRDVVGLTDLDRDVTELQYPLRFPEQNRDSVVAATTPFTHRNRNDDSVREEYADVVRTVAESPGNVLICMPSYAEAAWAADLLEESVEKPVLVDESSDNAATQELKERFFASSGSVLVTSVRGTLTEGVDYSGKRLSAALVCGVPFVGIGPRSRAVVAAYEDKFGDDSGFEYAMTVPAVRKARQALGRVIRGEDDVGVRVFADERYATADRWNSAREYLPESERSEFEPIPSATLEKRLSAFWAAN